MQLRQTFSNFHADKINVAAPVLPFVLTVEIVQDDGVVPFSFTVPGCLYVPWMRAKMASLVSFNDRLISVVKDVRFHV